MDNPTSPSRRSGNAPPLTFSLSQAAALCGVPIHRLSEWVDFGYVRSSGHGDGRRLDRHALRQILALRNATGAGILPQRLPSAPSSHRAAPAAPAAPTRRPEEFFVSAFPLNDARLSVQIEVYFALNPDAPRTAEHLAHALHADLRQTRRILDSMTDAGLVRGFREGEIVYGPGRSRLRGPDAREQRIRATRRHRVPADS